MTHGFRDTLDPLIYYRGLFVFLNREPREVASINLPRYSVCARGRCLHRDPMMLCLVCQLVHARLPMPFDRHGQGPLCLGWRLLQRWENWNILMAA
ncbi:hypothetical protein CEXT_529761 [Caerostris extrusa]|uniref:Uncharacterized protein n=1 Tax=Caerostris extrusa TaxID=172846 RepID=A0AAV4T9S5_CAEEX|nr:hypothetical protein CEXT_529761 [Caerostris extrusa]